MKDVLLLKKTLLHLVINPISYSLVKVINWSYLGITVYNIPPVHKVLLGVR